ncbi:TPA: helix-turn-helix transcriptional regulator, partial [Klebsiella pneumoniae]|nr:helix-turn-helix transcriptional regulator [Klebsiella pneumoniae]
MLGYWFDLDANMNFEERLLRALDEAGISQSELGRRVGVNSQTVSNWCNTGNFPRKEKLELFPQALGKPLYWFFMTDE